MAIVKVNKLIPTLKVKSLPGLIALALLLMVNQSFAADTHIHKVNMVDCHQDFCVKVVAPSLQISSGLSRNYVFSDADISVTGGQGMSQRAFTGFEGYFDPLRKSFILRKKGHDTEYVIDTNDHKVYEFSVN